MIGSLAPIGALVFDYRKWKAQRKVDYLRSERDKLERLFRGIYDRLTPAIGQRNYPIDLTTDILLLCPSEVREAFETLIQDKDDSPDSRRTHLWQISLAMKRSLVELDKKIEESM